MHENVLNFKLDLVAGTEGAIRYVDVARCMSLVNRKLYRQQGLWTVLGARAWFQETAAPANLAVPFSVAIRGAPRTWCTRNALVKAFERWKDQQASAYAAVGTGLVKPKWQDFKVYLSKDHYDGTELLPTSGDQFGATDPYSTTGSEWIQSKFVYEISDGAGATQEYEPTMHIIGNDDGTTSVGAILQYQETRVIPFTPDPELPAGIDNNIYVKMSDALADQQIAVLDNMTTDNNDPPYDPDDYPGGDSNANKPQSFALASSPAGPAATIPRILNLNGFSAPNGLLEIQLQSQKSESNAGVFWLQLIVGQREAY